jgi:hypothetical protein
MLRKLYAQCGYDCSPDWQVGDVGLSCIVVYDRAGTPQSVEWKVFPE